MPSVRYYNQTAPFWDFVANLEEQGANHPFFGQRGGAGADNDNEQANPWANGWAGFPFGPFPHRGRHAPPPHQQGPPAAEGEHDEGVQTSGDEKAAEAGPSDPRGPPPPFAEHEGHRHAHHHGSNRHGRGGGGPYGRCGGRQSRPGGGWGGRGRGGHPFAGPGGFPSMGGFGAMAEMLQNQIFGEHGNTATGAAAAENSNSNSKETNEDFKPEADVFDTPEAFVVHISLPGAKKEDVGVNWDSEKSELNVAGVVYRPGDEDLLKTLALDERKIGPFERKIRLGSRANPAQVDVDGITAKMEDGVLRVEVPKLDGGYVEIRKVDIE